ncbi:response regulator transcription factor [Flavobacterium sp. GT3R68]|uniref:response regulator transcription factor n=1 Tax=Flavobacterium sp. GT3R68 TaxID=2594437 RepID=UPI000F899F26|nr:response regulator transcription factor [Flavobacterium sp. GT3R68]RTY94917.1 response regulator transcription factor [Flavobacterium sp. GSN2]TRW91721.1 response regulator transcription factor [Flavobacterium sp. GT3R68]
MRKVLLAEDDFDFASVLKQYLELYDYTVTWAKTGEEALSIFKKQTFNICVFDVMMPKMDGFTLAEKIITLNPEIPFVFLIARKLKEDKIIGLKLGADDYIVKPFEADELVLRLNNILKRSEPKIYAINPIAEIPIGNYIFNPARLELKLANHTQRLTEKEVALIVFLFKNKNQLIKRNEILQAVWSNEDFFSGRSMDVFISRLRKYLKDDIRISIESIRNIGLEFRIID